MKKRYKEVGFILLGVAALFWFLIRVIPKPSRAAYPCQRAAFPVASAFVLWLIGTFGSLRLFKYGREVLNKHKQIRGVAIILGGGVLFFVSLFLLPGPSGFAGPLASINDRFEDPFQGKITNQKKIVVPVEDHSSNQLESLPAIVAAVQSPHADVYDITFEEVEAMIREVVEKAGGLEDIISDGDTVVLKPNLVLDNGTDPFNGVTTNPWVIEITAKIVREINPNGRIILMEATAGISGSAIMDSLGLYDIEYIDEWIAIEEVSGGWGEYDSPKLVAVEPPDSLSLYADDLKPNKTRALYFNKLYYEADVVISLPTIKNHRTAGISGAVKNTTMGTVPSNIYGEEGRTGRTANLRHAGLDHSFVEIHNWLHDFYAAKPIDFTIMDGLQGIQYGPTGTNNAQKNMRLMLAGKDPIAVDAIMSLAMMYDPQKVNYLVHLHNHDYGIVDPSMIKLKGVSIPEVRKDFLHNDDADLSAKYSKTTASDYEASYDFTNNEIHLSVTNPDSDLVRLTLNIDDQFIGKYILGGFDDVVISTSEINFSDSVVDILFEDRYLNAIQKIYQPEVVTGVAEVQESNLKIYPNPATDVLYVDFDGISNYRIRIYDINGGVIETHRTGLGLNSLSLSLEEIPEGYYVVEIQTQNARITRSFLKR